MALICKKNITPSIFIPYGLEIELENVEFEYGKRVISHKIPENWKVGIDRSLLKDGIEISSDVFSNTKEEIVLLKKLSKTLEHLGATFEHSSVQINLDAYDLNDDDILNLLKMYSVYENVNYRFSLGKEDVLRDNIMIYARPIQEHFHSKYHVREGSFRYARYINARTYGIKLKTLTKNDKDSIKVIEFRTPKGCSDYRLWLNYITFYSSLLSYVKGSNFDKELIDYKFENMKFVPISEMTHIDEKSANELSDMIFLDDIDATNFKEQYFSVNRKLI